MRSSIIAAALLLWPAQAPAADYDQGLRTGWSHMVRVLSFATVGLEAGIPRGSWYAKAIELDRKGQYKPAYNAYRKARSEFRMMLQKQPQNAKRIRGWILKAQQQSSLSYTLDYQRRYTHWRRYRSYYRSQSRANTLHNKWLAIRAFSGRAPAKLLKEAISSYRTALQLRSSYLPPRLQLAGLYCEIGKWKEARQVFSGVRMPVSRSYWMQLAYYYTVAGQRQKALEYVRKAITRSRYMRRYFLHSNFFDRLRGDPRFESLVGSP